MKLTLLLFSFIACTTIAASPATTTQFIIIDKFGYRNNNQKIAVISNPQVGCNAALSFTPGNEYQIRNLKSNALAFTSSPVAGNNGAKHDQSLDKVWWFDFVNEIYFIQIKNYPQQTQKFIKQ